MKNIKIYVWILGCIKYFFLSYEKTIKAIFIVSCSHKEMYSTDECFDKTSNQSIFGLLRFTAISNRFTKRHRVKVPSPSSLLPKYPV